MTSSTFGVNPLGYVGIDDQVQPQFISVDRAPNTNDWQSFNPGDEWRDISVDPPDVWQNVSVANQMGIWRKTTSSSSNGITELTADSGSNPVLPDGMGNINILGGTGVSTVATANTITINATGGGGSLDSLTGNTGSPVFPLSSNINIHGQNNITVTGVPSSHELDISLIGIVNHAVIVGGASNVLQNFTLADGHLLIGATGLDPVSAELTAGTGISIVSGPGSITISASGSGMGFTSIKEVKFESSGTYTPSSSTQSVLVRMVGGGGGGGNAPITNPSAVALGGGGGGGEYAEWFFDIATIGASQPVTIGAGGSSSMPQGGTTSLGSLLSAVGGFKGNDAVSSAVSVVAGGAGGITSPDGKIRISGQTGGSSFGFAAVGTVCGLSGYGGSSNLGHGANQPGISATATSSAGSNGSLYGAGGSGAATAGSFGSTTSGGSGANGVVIITEYIS